MDADEDDHNEHPDVVAAREEWRSQTTALERIQQVVERTTSSKTAAGIADEALVSEPTARKHLQSLIDTGVATAFEEPEATRYARNEDTLLYQRIRDLAAEQSREELLETVQRLKSQIRELEEAHDATSPEELVTQLESDAPSAAWTDVSEWQTAERDLHIVQAAINYRRARNLGAATQ